jgi:hypothetical protein
MTAVPIILELPARPDTNAGPDEVTVIDMEDFTEGNKCSCSAGDDQPY